MSTTGGPATCSAASFGSGQVVLLGTWPFSVLQTESVMKLPGVPSCVLRARASVLAVGFVKLMNET